MLKRKLVDLALILVAFAAAVLLLTARLH